MKHKIKKLAKNKFSAKTLMQNAKEAQIQQEMMQKSQKVISQVIGLDISIFLPTNNWDMFLMDLHIFKNPKNIYWNKRN